MELNAELEQRILDLDATVETKGQALFTGPVGQMLGADAPLFGEFLEAHAERAVLKALKSLKASANVETVVTVGTVKLSKEAE